MRVDSPVKPWRGLVQTHLHCGGRATSFFRVSLAIALGLLSQAQTVPVVRLYPVDDTARDPAFRSFVGKLGSAVRTRNSKAFRKLVDDEVVVGPAEADKGWPRFVEKWRPDDSESPMWEPLADMLSLGFIREHPSLYLSPYVVWRFPDALNRLTHLVLIRDQVSLRQSPSPSAPSAALLSFDVVERLGQSERRDGLGEWVHVRTLDGKTGYVNTRDVRSPLMPRAQFGRRRGHWVLLGLEGSTDRPF